MAKRNAKRERQNGSDSEWLRIAKNDIKDTGEWSRVQRALLVNIESLVIAGGSERFADIEDDSKFPTLQTAVRRVQESEEFGKLRDKVMAAVDARLLEAVKQREIASRGLAHSTVLDHIQDVMLDCVSKCGELLHRWPDLAYCVRLCANRPLPARLRRAYWRAQWRNVDLESEFLRRCRSAPRTTVSVNDVKLGQRINIILASEEFRDDVDWQRNSQDLAKLALKRLVSAYDSCVPLGRNTGVSDFAIQRAIPIVHTLVLSQVPESQRATHSDATTQPSTEQLSKPRGKYRLDNEVMAEAIGAFAEFEDILPLPCQPLTFTATKKAADDLACDVEKLVREHDIELYDHLHRVLKGTEPMSPVTPSSADANADTKYATDREAPFYKHLRNGLTPCWQVLFSGFLPMDVVCFLWEQMWIFEETDSPHSYLAIATATWLLLLSEELKKCTKPSTVDRCLYKKSKALTVYDFQIKIVKFLSQLQAASASRTASRRSGKSAPAGRRSFMSTSTVVGQLPPWENWSSGKYGKASDWQSEEPNQRMLRRLIARGELCEEDRERQPQASTTQQELLQENTMLRQLLLEKLRQDCGASTAVGSGRDSGVKSQGNVPTSGDEGKAVRSHYPSSHGIEPAGARWSSGRDGGPQQEETEHQSWHHPSQPTSKQPPPMAKQPPPMVKLPPPRAKQPPSMAKRPPRVVNHSPPAAQRSHPATQQPSLSAGLSPLVADQSGRVVQQAQPVDEQSPLPAVRPSPPIRATGAPRAKSKDSQDVTRSQHSPALSQVPVPMPPRAQPARATPDDEALDFLRATINGIGNGIKDVVHGPGQFGSQALEEEMSERKRHHTNEFREMERELFGVNLSKAQWKAMPEEEAEQRRRTLYRALLVVRRNE